MLKERNVPNTLLSLSGSCMEGDGLPWWPGGKESSCNAGGDAGLIPGSGKSPWGGHVNSLQYTCLENSMDRGTFRATVPGVARVGHDGVTFKYCSFISYMYY